jgi:hypothetical protein
MLRGTVSALSVDHEMAEDTLVSLHRLQSAFLELSTALNETLRDERVNAAACLQRARANAAEYQLRNDSSFRKHCASGPRTMANSQSLDTYRSKPG